MPPGKLKPGETWRQAGILDTVFEGRVEELPDGKIIPHVSGRAWVNGESTYLFNPADPFRHGIPTHLTTTHTMSIQWKGVMPATLTQFNADLTIDHGLMAEHGKWLIENGCTAIVAHGSLGEGATLSFEEKIALQKTYVAAVPDTPIIPGIAALSTREAVDLAKAAKDNGCRGLMVLPPYLYSSDWREMKAHMTAVISATDLPCIIYNNPVAYKTDFIPAHIKELADELPNVAAVKESSTDARRIAGIREALRRPRGARRGRR